MGDREVTISVPREDVPHVRDALIEGELHHATEALLGTINRYHDPAAPPLKLSGEGPASPEELRSALGRLATAELLIGQLGWNPSDDGDREVKAPGAFLYKLAVDGVRAAYSSGEDRAAHYTEDPVNRDRLRWRHGEARAFMALLETLEDLEPAQLGEEGGD